MGVGALTCCCGARCPCSPHPVPAALIPSSSRAGQGIWGRGDGPPKAFLRNCGAQHGSSTTYRAHTAHQSPYLNPPFLPNPSKNQNETCLVNEYGSTCSLALHSFLEKAGFNCLPWKSPALATRDGPGKGAVVLGNGNIEPTGGRRKE